MPKIQAFIDRVRYWCDTANMGYSQTDRWNFNPEDGNCDCATLIIHSLNETGFDTGAASWTGNLSRELTMRGWDRIANDGHPQPGDLLINDKRHVALYIGGGLLCQASISENATTDGAPGDQTGGETNTTVYYDYPWDCYLRYTGDEMLSEEEMQHIAALTNSYRYGNDPNTTWNYLTGNFNVAQGIAAQLAQVQTTLSAQAATIETLAKSMGADPTTIASTVQQAVKDKLDKLHITVEEVRP